MNRKQRREQQQNEKPIIITAAEPVEIETRYWKYHFWRLPYEDNKCPICDTALSRYYDNESVGALTALFTPRDNNKICLTCGMFDHHNFTDPDNGQTLLFTRRGMGFKIAVPLYSDYFTKCIRDGLNFPIPMADNAAQQQLEQLTVETIELWKSDEFRHRWHSSYWKPLEVEDPSDSKPLGRKRKVRKFMSNMMDEHEFMVFADWLGDNNYYENEKVLREQIAS